MELFLIIMMKRKIFISFLLSLMVLIGMPVFAQNSLLWEISGNGIAAPSYLYGTIHIQDKRVFDFNDSLMPKLFECSTFAMEINMDSVDETKLMGMMFIEDGKTLEDLYSKKDYKLIKKVFKKKMGFEITMFNTMKPFAIMTLMEASEMMKGKKEDTARKNMKEEMDLYLAGMAKDSGKKVIGIETVDEQMAVVSKMPPSLLIEYLKNIDKEDKETDKLIEAYRHEELDKVLEMLDDKKSPFGAEFNDEILTKRNHIMADRISNLIKEKTIFIAIGAGHLPGKEGVIELLRKKGFNVRAVMAPHTFKK
jgi:uncharacterized protein YbaP (TraB family)